MYLFVWGVGLGCVVLFLMHKQACRHRKFLGGNLRCSKTVGDELRFLFTMYLYYFFSIRKM